MFNWLFNKKQEHSKRLSKIEYWGKWELFDLFNELDKAESLLVDIQKDDNQSQLSDFTNNLIEELYEIKYENVSDFTRIWNWFSPSKEWESFLGERGKEIGENVFRITDRWKRNQDFLLGTKVSLGNEFGVVLDTNEDWNEYGLIRWDTEKENDIEDWRGLFGSFLQAGGKIVDQDHKFIFIEDNGETKR